MQYQIKTKPKPNQTQHSISNNIIINKSQFQCSLLKSTLREGHFKRKTQNV